MLNKNLSICLLVALLLRLSFVFIGFPRLESPWHLREDGDNYQTIANSIRDGHYEDVTRGPGYPVFVAALHSPRLIKLAQVFLDVFTCLLLWQLTKNVWAAWLWALYPFAIWRVAFINKEVLLTFLIVSYLCVQVRAFRTGTNLHWLAAGELLGVLNLCKPTFLLWPLLLIPFAPKRVVLLIVGMLFIILPWTMRNAWVTGGRFLPVATEMGGFTTFVGNYQATDGLWEGPGKARWMAAAEEVRAENAGASAIDLDRAFYRAAWDEVLGNPLKAVTMAVRKCGRFWFLSAARREQIASLLIQGIYLALAGIGLWRCGLRERETGLLVALTGYVMLVHALSYADIRFSLLVMPCVCALASRTFVTRSAAVRTS